MRLTLQVSLITTGAKKDTRPCGSRAWIRTHWCGWASDRRATC